MKVKIPIKLTVSFIAEEDSEDYVKFDLEKIKRQIIRNAKSELKEFLEYSYSLPICQHIKIEEA